jgi:hypothetical protein
MKEYYTKLRKEGTYIYIYIAKNDTRTFQCQEGRNILHKIKKEG